MTTPSTVPDGGPKQPWDSNRLADNTSYNPPVRPELYAKKTYVYQHDHYEVGSGPFPDGNVPEGEGNISNPQ